MKLHKVLLSGCVNCTIMYQSFGRNIYSKHRITFARAFSSRQDAAQTPIIWRTATLLSSPMYTVPLGNRKPMSHGRNCIDIWTRHQLRKPLSASVSKDNLLPGGSAWPGKSLFIITGKIKLTNLILVLGGSDIWGALSTTPSPHAALRC